MIRRLDLGSGAKGRPGFVTFDRFRLPNVSVQGDLDAPRLPFPDDTFDLVVAFHSLEHVADLMATMREVWRVCRPGAQVCVTAPYYTAQLNLANPYHLQCFNEHTPRFWTTAAETLLPEEEWWEPPLSKQWGLGASDHSDPGMDLRCVSMELFYFAPWDEAAPDERRRARKERFNVCEQILYHLLAVKPAGAEADLRAWADETELYQPPELAPRRKWASRPR